MWLNSTNRRQWLANESGQSWPVLGEHPMSLLDETDLLCLSGVTMIPLVERLGTHCGD
jgi:hypothetical protein